MYLGAVAQFPAFRVRPNLASPYQSLPSKVLNVLTVIPTLDLDTQRTSSWSCVISVDGELDRLTVPALEEVLHAEMANERIRRLVVDLRKVEFVDGRGLSVLVDAAEAMRESGRRFCVVCTDPHLLRVLTLVDARGRVDVVRSRPRALGDAAA